MPPIRSYVCRDCDAEFDFLEFAGDDTKPQCNECQSLSVSRTLTAPGGYSINGDNSASVRPKQAGAFKKGKK